MRVSTSGSDGLDFFAGRLCSSSTSSDSAALASALAACLAAFSAFSRSAKSAARFPPQGAPCLPCLFFSFSYRAMSGAMCCSMSLALDLALRPPVELTEGVSFSLPARTCRTGVSNAGFFSFSAPPAESSDPSRLTSKSLSCSDTPITTPSAGPLLYALSSAVSRTLRFLLAPGVILLSPPG